MTANEITENLHIYLSIITKYDFKQVATASLVPKLDTYDTNVSNRYITEINRTLIVLVASKMWQLIFTNWV